MGDQKIDIRQEDFKEIFDTYFPSLCVFANRFMKNEEIAKDIVQEAMLKIWKSQQVFHSRKSMRVYFYLTTKNTCLDYLAKEKKRKTDDLTENIMEDKNVIHEIIREETYRLLEDAIDQLGEKQQEVIKLNISGYSNKEIAEELGVSINTVKTHKLTAYRQLREIFGKQFVTFLLVEFYQFLS